MLVWLSLITCLFGKKNRCLELFFLGGEAVKMYMEDHPRTCKWLESPPFISHEKDHLEGEQPDPFGTYDHHGYSPHTNWDDPPRRYLLGRKKGRVNNLRNRA